MTNSASYKENPRGGRLGIAKLYDTVVEILMIAENPSYVSKHEGARLKRLMEVMEQQISEFYPGLRNILMPQAATRKYNRGEEIVITPPTRWDEPYVQHYLKTFKQLTSAGKYVSGRGSVENDIVYRTFTRSDIRERINDRFGMDSHEYDRLKDIAEKSEKRAKDADTSARSASTALARRKPGELALPDEGIIRLETASPGVLAIESGFYIETVRKHRKSGLSGQNIIDEKSVIDERKTSGAVVHDLRESGLSEQSTEIIDLSRSIEVSIKKLLQCMERLGITDVSVLEGAADEMASDVRDIAEQYSRREQTVWRRAMEIYSAEGGGDTTKTVDILWRVSSAAVDDSEEDDPLDRSSDAAENFLKRLRRYEV